ncbi:TPA: hypothetical protein HA273_05780 [Candidatus Bathyarchaeota archaeon]|nr:hypothetical protein [Candidatus Bathyarchaeota archaeon]HIJ07878.1 hypothetical protein [Candidatus Bathyarchaeota archaeon]
MRRTAIAVTAVVGVAFLLLLWAPWITDEFAIGRVVDKLGGPEARFNYLGEDMTVKDIPKQAAWLPFCRFVTFPGEAG